MELNHTRTMGKSISYIKEVKWREDTIIRINEADTNANRHGSNESWKISKPPKALVDVKPQSYCPQILTIGPLYEMLGGSSSLYDCKALCVNKFIKGHEISDVEELMQRLFYDPSDLHIHYSGLPKYSSESLQLLVTVDTIFIREFLLFMPTEWDSILEEHTQFCTLCNNDITYKQVGRDLFVMGNQIPMSFLMKLVEEFPKKQEFKWDELQEGLFYAVATNDPFLISQSLSLTEIVEIFETPEFVNCNHLLDCLYVWVLRERPQKKNQTQGTNRCRFPRLPNPLWMQQAAHKLTTCTFPRLLNPFGTEQAAHKITKCTFPRPRNPFRTEQAMSNKITTCIFALPWNPFCRGRAAHKITRCTLPRLRNHFRTGQAAHKK